MTKVLVTGATGFLGTNITLILLEQDYEVRALGLPGSTTKYIEKDKVEIMFGDITDSKAVKKAIKGVDIILHVAGDTSFWKKFYERQRKVNIDGVRNIMQAAYDADIEKVVHTATVDTIGYNPEGLTDEHWDDDPSNFNYNNMGYNYAETKREGEKIAFEFAKKGLNVTIINPGSMMGPFDYSLNKNSFGRVFFDIRDGKLPMFPSGGCPWAYVVEVAKAHVRAIDKGKTGERYICGGVNETYKKCFTLIAESMGLNPPKMIAPKLLLVIYGKLSGLASRFTKKPPNIDAGQARYLASFPKYNSSKAERELGFKSLPLKEIVQDAYDWYEENGFF